MPLEKLDGSQFDAASEALAFAFPDYDALDMMLWGKLDRTLSNYDAPGPLPRVLKNLLRGAQSEGWLEDLIKGALLARPNNPKLKELAPLLLLNGTGVPSQELQAIVLRNNGFQDIDMWRAGLDAVRKAVCRFQVKLTNRGDEVMGLGSGFLVAEDVVLTNRHVVDMLQSSPVKSPAIQFDYRVTTDGTREEGEVLSLDGEVTDWLIGSSPAATLDYALIRLPRRTGRPVMATPKPYVFTAGDIYFIVQHPRGEPMKLCAGTMAGTQEATATDPPCVKYTTNTEGGSSGSPVFNLDWTPVALHRAAAIGLNAGVPLQLVHQDAVKQGIWPTAA